MVKAADPVVKPEPPRRRGAVPPRGKDRESQPQSVGRGSRSQRSGATPAPARATAPVADRFYALWNSGQLAALLLALACGAAITCLLTLDLWQVRQFDLAGARLTNAEQVIGQAAVSGHNIFTVDPEQVARQLATLPTIREAQVWGELPDRLVIQLVERQPVLLWQVGDTRFLLDQRGFVIGQVGNEQQSAVPVVQVRDIEPPTIGSTVDPAIVAAVLTIQAQSAETGLPVNGISYAPGQGLTLTLPGARPEALRTIVLGSATRLDEKLVVAGVVLRSGGDWTTLNLTDPDRPVVPAPAATPTH